MSDNEDERLDRAKRIRKMREGGNSQGDSEDETQDAVEEDDTGSSDDEEADEIGESNDDSPDPTGVVPETTDLEVEEADKPSLDVEEDIRAPLPDTGELEDALEAGSEGDSEDVTSVETATADALGDEDQHEEETRVLEFRLGDEYYCLDIDYIEEIVKEETVTRVPNTPEFVEGVVDLRGQITTILNPKVTVGKDDVTPGELIIVFDSDSFEDQGHVGWVVDDVRQVSPITDSDVNDPPVDEEYINGVIDRKDDEEFVIWTEPDMAMEKAE